MAEFTSVHYPIAVAPSGGGGSPSPVWTQITGDRSAGLVQSPVAGPATWVLTGTGPYTWTLQGTAAIAQDGVVDCAHFPVTLTDLLPAGFNFETHSLLLRMDLTSHFRAGNGTPHIGPSVAVRETVTGTTLGEALTNGSATLENTYNQTASSAAARDTLIRGGVTNLPVLIAEFGWTYDEGHRLYCIPTGQGANGISKAFNTFFVPVGGGESSDTDDWQVRFGSFLLGGGTALNDTFSADYYYSWAERPVFPTV